MSCSTAKPCESEREDSICLTRLLKSVRTISHLSPFHADAGWISGNGNGLVKDFRLHRHVELHEAFLQNKIGLTTQTARMWSIHDPHCQPALATRRKSSWSAVIGLCQPPAGETLCSTSLGPQPPFSYS